MAGHDGGNSELWADFKLWYYVPNMGAAIAFTVAFALLTSGHLFRLLKARTWFCIPFIVGAIFETIGYAARIVAHSNTDSLVPFIIQSILILIAPALLAASIYMILGRIIRNVGAEHHSWVRTNWLTKIFVCGDVLCFFIQSSGGGLLAVADTQSQVSIYENIVLGGLILQIVIFLIFVATAGVFHRRLRRQPTDAAVHGSLPWERLMLMLYAVSLLITVRNIVRVLEYATGNTGYLLTHEWTLYVFDALLMAITLAIGLMWYVPSIGPESAAKREHITGSEQQLRPWV